MGTRACIGDELSRPSPSQAPIFHAPARLSPVPHRFPSLTASRPSLVNIGSPSLRQHAQFFNEGFGQFVTRHFGIAVWPPSALPVTPRPHAKRAVLVHMEQRHTLCRRHRRKGPLMVHLSSGAAVFVFTFVGFVAPLVWLGITGLVAASAWDFVIGRRAHQIVG